MKCSFCGRDILKGESYFIHVYYEKDGRKQKITYCTLCFLHKVLAR